MTITNLPNGWTEKVLALKYRSTNEQNIQFVQLIDQAEGNCNLDVCCLLLSLFVDGDDDGVLESVSSVLASAEPTDYISALMAELPRLVDDNVTDWAEVMVGQAIDEHLNLVKSISLKQPDNVKSALKSIISDSDFKDFYPNSSEIEKLL
ncbi:hypothetical protein [Pseudoalteromonas luteoviolacea]|uniref:Immunity protein 30 domain-containing protein n=1 Tax=Pseudoalteromonas luteoviolacea H33 TaxID=1365251 RepID=A0A167DYH2_9GAMM|nr:hypothetical protein [Pseudoalteromonas luteoviolacea]KZN49756.1 hypothetical protein N476_18360 [Pseudoalteromonas luteoviolacea H33]KZN77780.1 hypothetical protein N477_00815 [Pseudoalteromonas luteoviolacea H33-S]MBQ4878736.1 hypothetical protein [Pseudoalteromonas luteoviolacea]MBQ4907856.1 hypothetical protein [Pseudoalteromonas luteoviolacea]